MLESMPFVAPWARTDAENLAIVQLLAEVAGDSTEVPEISAAPASPTERLPPPQAEKTSLEVADTDASTAAAASPPDARLPNNDDTVGFVTPTGAAAPRTAVDKSVSAIFEADAAVGDNGACCVPAPSDTASEEMPSPRPPASTAAVPAPAASAHHDHAALVTAAVAALGQSGKERHQLQQACESLPALEVSIATPTPSDQGDKEAQPTDACEEASPVEAARVGSTSFVKKTASFQAARAAVSLQQAQAARASLSFDGDSTEGRRGGLITRLAAKAKAKQ